MKETEQEKVYKWLVEGKLNFTELIEAYVEYLQNKEKEKNDIITGLAFPLVIYWQNTKLPKKQKVLIKAEAAFYLLKSKVFKTAEIEKDLEKSAKGFINDINNY